MQVHRTTVTLQHKSFITPNFLRLVLHCDTIDIYKDVPIGVNNKLFIPPKGHSTVAIPTFNAEKKVWEIENEALRPTVRTYTHRAIDLEAQTLTVDFAVHDGDTVACDWALTANIGDEIGLAMKLSHRDVLPAVDHFLFITDMTGIPVVASLVKSLPKNATATIVTEVLTPEDILESHYTSDATLTLEWLINPTPHEGSILSKQAITHWESMPAPHFTHITAEYSTVKTLRDFLRHEKGQTKETFFACAYWQIDKREDEAREKRLD